MPGVGRLALVKRLAWYLNVPFRTVRAFVPALARPDDTFAARWLPPAELELYLAMDVRDRDHACRVARAVLRRHPEAPEKLVRASLLHDVGKSGAPFSPWLRVAVHVYRPRQAPAPGAGSRLADALRRHHQHPQLGAAMILACGGDPDVAELVRHHHDAEGPPGADAIRSVDALT